MSGMAGSSAPGVATDAVMVKSEAMPAGSERVKGYDFNLGVDHHALLQSYRLSGFQATNFGVAVDQINAMVRERLSLNLFSPLCECHCLVASRVRSPEESRRSRKIWEEMSWKRTSSSGGATTAPFSSATHPTWRRAGSGRALGSSCSTRWSTASWPQLVVSRRTS